MPRRPKLRVAVAVEKPPQPAVTPVVEGQILHPYRVALTVAVLAQLMGGPLTVKKAIARSHVMVLSVLIICLQVVKRQIPP